VSKQSQFFSVLYAVAHINTELQTHLTGSLSYTVVNQSHL